ncbi:ComEA family DNA-binding protein [Alkalilimnicola sp. S0819]|uniref:ComEA family DNA-binding protein n=1 Tax=Alkalilimnicola sp. S0819 TaxID=2613922 RepID=UPI00126251A1|nr:ComEA family DNA-binding protein [Alkalilimnicola sp. S0819]KAB7623653.1 ComEA family DNA-binding protein [Alkalilimnicola sp. S0819]MPQ16777.1 hypothetical protein [Alkalilimnicola sp. S0819]
MRLLRKTAFACLLAGASLAALAASPININTADAQSIAALHGIGQAKAEAIVAYRKANGPFASVEDLRRVKGIGVRTLEANQGRISLQ